MSQMDLPPTASTNGSGQGRGGRRRPARTPKGRQVDPAALTAPTTRRKAKEEKPAAQARKKSVRK